ncbi:AmmeMemoRadiSam system radical SAM enzyme [Patescibacteria group bacterium]|nr:AmmeMemoRadiSam system radical SAM enzyme [Patescibacteria group bacterium]MBU0963501.1 AmmeMemoRadiSam system radical SAM enzyme [Patescibacteria group bacterium]
MKEALLYEKLDQNKVQCHVCNHHCSILPGQRGTCGVRENQDGTLYLLVYAKAISESIDPIEKKPFFHFLPGSRSLSIATVGCNFRCNNCQNWQISQASKKTGYTDLHITGEDLPPDKVIQDAIESKCRSIAYTYTEPTIWMDYAYDCMKLAHKQNIKNVWVSNGYMSDKTLKLILPYLDAINIDLKFFDNKNYQKNCGGKLKPILENLITIKKAGVWLEITTLAIPTLSDSDKMFYQIAEFIKKELGAETPWHISAFSPAISYKLQNLPPTKTKTLVMAHAIGKKAGLKYVYTGNIPGLDSENTFCPKCGNIIITRRGFSSKRHDQRGKCSKCSEIIEIITE